ncbi:ataxin-2 isoform X4 [Amblyraja radiata]|uniref:ataxin-2 isoform X4 n=1 Tax=Amblyraja radiata TaxID=386614 RepID=UPI00140362D0|nr:ataxin-2 isoform X4 [Amblyraja radiata]
MSMKQAGSRKPGGGLGATGTGGGSRQSGGRGRSSGKGPPQPTIQYDGIYANMRMVHILTSVVGAKCELKVKNGGMYEGVFKTYSPKCDLVLDAAHRKKSESSSREVGPKREDIVESIIFKSADIVLLHFKDVDLNYARRVPSETDAFTDAAIGSRLNGEHKDKDLEPWDGGDSTNEDLEALESDVSNGWDPNDMFRFNEETYGVRSTYDSSLSSYTVALERDNSEEFLRREARAAQLAEEIESSAQYKARAALENDERTEEEKYTAVQRSPNERESHGVISRENKYIPPGQRNRDGMSWGSARQHSPRIGQSGSGPPPSRAGSHTSDYSPNSGTDQRVVNGGVPWPSPCPSPSSRPPSRYPSASTSLPPQAASPTRPPSRPSRPPSHPSTHGSPAPVSTMPKRISSEGPPRMSPKAQRHPRHRGPSGRVGMSSSLDYIPHSVSGEISAPVPRNSSSGGTWSSVVSGGSSTRLSPKTHRPRSPRHGNQPTQYISGGSPSGMILSSQPGSVPAEPIAAPATNVSPTPASPATNRAVTPSAEVKDARLQEQKQSSPSANKETPKPVETCGTSPSLTKPGIKATSPMASDHKKQIADLKKFREDFRLQTTSTPDPVVDQFNKSREGVDNQPKDLIKEKITVIEPGSKESTSDSSSNANTSNGSSKPSSPSNSPNIITSEQKRGPDVTSQAVQTTGPNTKAEKEEKEDKKEGTPEQVRKSTLNPNAKEFNPKAFYTPPKPTTTPTPPRPQAQPSPSIVVQQHPPTVYNQPMCFTQNMVYPVPVSPGVQPTHMYHVPMTPMPINQAKSYRAGKVPTMQQQRPDQHHPQGTPTMMHPVSAAGQIVSTAPAYSQYVAYNPQQFANQPLVQSVAHYQSQPQMYSQVMQSNARMMAPPGHGQPGMVPSSTAQFPTAEQTHAMYVSPGPIHQQYAPHPTATLHPHPPHPQQSATPTGQQQGQHAGSHPAQSPVQHPQHQAPQTLHLGNPQQQQAIYHTTLTPTPPSMAQGPNPQSPQTNFPSAQQTVYALHPQQVQHGYSNPPHMAHVPQAHVQSGMGPPHHPATTHPPMMLMPAQPPGGQGAIPQNAMPPIPVSSTTHFSYMAHPQVQAHHQQQL